MDTGHDWDYEDDGYANVAKARENVFRPGGTMRVTKVGSGISRVVHPIFHDRRGGEDRRQSSQFARDQFDRNAVRPTDAEMGDPPRRAEDRGD